MLLPLQGGREFLRVLNELFMDFEELFNEPKYKDVEKIKTIGACFMGASGTHCCAIHLFSLLLLFLLYRVILAAVLYFMIYGTTR